MPSPFAQPTLLVTHLPSLEFQDCWSPTSSAHLPSSCAQPSPLAQLRVPGLLVTHLPSPLAHHLLSAQPTCTAPNSRIAGRSLAQLTCPALNARIAGRPLAKPKCPAHLPCHEFQDCRSLTCSPHPALNSRTAGHPLAQPSCPGLLVAHLPSPLAQPTCPAGNSRIAGRPLA